MAPARVNRFIRTMVILATMLAAAGDLDAALALVDKARFQAEAALRQAEYESTAWQDRVIK